MNEVIGRMFTSTMLLGIFCPPSLHSFARPVTSLEGGPVSNHSRLRLLYHTGAMFGKLPRIDLKGLLAEERDSCCREETCC
jgi:hypothetical protein